MYRKVIASAIVGGLLVTALASAQPDPQKGPPKGGVGKGPPGGMAGFGPMRAAWEYKSLSRRDLLAEGREAAGDGGLTDGFNKLGADGWELVAIDSGSSVKSSTYIFKRSAMGRRMFERKKDVAPPKRGEFEEKKDFVPPKRGEPEPKKKEPGRSGFGFGGTGTFGSALGQPRPTTTFGSGTFSNTTGFSPRPNPKHEIRLIRLKNAEAVELTKVLRPFLDPNAVIVPDPRTNALVLASDPATFEQIQRLVIALDEPDGKR